MKTLKYLLILLGLTTIVACSGFQVGAGVGVTVDNSTPQQELL